MTEFLHDVVRERNFNQESLSPHSTDWIDPWDTPIPYTLIDDIVHPSNDELGVA